MEQNAFHDMGWNRRSQKKMTQSACGTTLMHNHIGWRCKLIDSRTFQPLREKYWDLTYIKSQTLQILILCSGVAVRLKEYQGHYHQW